MSQQLTLAETFKYRSAYSKDSHRHCLISKKLAIFIGSSNVPNSVVQNLEFKDLLYTVDSRYTIPGRAAMGRELNKVMIELKAKISSYLLEANKVSITADIWTKKGMSSSYLGVTGHFFSRKDHRRHVVTLAMRRMPSPHTAENIRMLVDDILSEWDIPSTMISAIILLTDNGSNMLAAFRSPLVHDDEDGGDGDQSDEDDVMDTSVVNDFELDHDLAFYSLKRVSCFAHNFAAGCA